MKKKVISVLLVGALVVSMGAIAGCGSSESTSEAEEEGQETEEEVTEEDVEDNEAVEDEAEQEEVAEEAEDTSEAASGDFAGTTITLEMDTDSDDSGIKAVCDLAEEELGITVDISYRVGGEEGDNLVKTGLSSGTMSDIFLYNPGALLVALNPSEYLLDLSSDSTIMDKLDDTFKDSVTVDGATYGIPVECSQAGAVLYNKDMYEEYGLEVPTSWDEFIANCDVLKDAGENAVIGTFTESWTTQVIFLGDNANVLAYDPDFPENFTDGTDNYETNPYALRSFEKTAQLNEYYNDDYLATTYDDGCDMLMNGEGAHWIILTGALNNLYGLYGDEVDNIGCFAVPADDADKTNLTVWMPSALYINKNSENVDACLAFFELYISEAGLNAYSEQLLGSGPTCIKGYTSPNAYEAVGVDMQAYFDDGKTAPAMEFLSDIKGTDCATICQECGSGQTTGQEAAEKYDADCKLTAQELGYEWALQD